MSPLPDTHEAQALARVLAHPDITRAASLELGVATSSFQAEGGLNGPGEPHTHWSRWESTGRVERAGAASGLWHRYPILASRARTLGLARVRVSLEWARLCPSGETVLPRVAEAYAARLATLHRAGVKPLVTLSHFTHPAWAGTDFWLDARAPEVFARYAVTAARAVGDALVHRSVSPMDRVITLNEPNMLALATYCAGVFPHVQGAVAQGDPLGLPRSLRALDHLMAAHTLAHRGLHRLYEDRGWPPPDVSTNLNVVDLYSVSKGLMDLMRAPSLGVRPTGLAEHLAACGQRFYADLFGHEARGPRAQAARAVESLAGRLMAPALFERTLGVLYQAPDRSPLDHLAMDLYDPYTLHQLPGSEGLFDALVAGRSLVDLAAMAAGGVRLAEPWEWRTEPDTLVRVLQSMTFPGPPLPIDVDENGMALHRPPGEPTRPRSDGATRPDFLRGYLRALLEARVVHDVPVRAWLYWTVVDNYELGRWSPRFGLYGLPDLPGAAGAAGARGAHTAAPWSQMDAAGHDAAGVLGATAHALRTHGTDAHALRAALGAALHPDGPTPGHQDDPTKPWGRVRSA